MLRKETSRKMLPLSWWLALAIGGITLIGGWGMWYNSPRLANASPQGDNLSALSPISLQFTQEMNHASVENRFHTEPKVEGVFSWNGNILTFTPLKEFNVGNVRVTLDAGATTLSGLPMWNGYSWQFAVPSTRIAFLFKINEVANLWVYPIGEDRLIQMTTEGMGVGEYAISPDGTQIIYTALREDGGADLKRLSRDGKNVTKFFECPRELCSFPTFSFDGKLLAFERTPLGQTATRIEVVDTTTSKTVTPPLLSNGISRSPLFARDGKLAFVNVGQPATMIYDFASARLTKIANTSGEVGTWSPDSANMVFPEIFFSLSANVTRTPDPNVKEYDKFYSNLLQVNLATNAVKTLTSGTTIEDGSPTYSSNGEWIAFSRRTLIESQWSPGRQLWLVKPDGTNAHALTNDPFYNHSAFVWNPSGNTLLYMRFDVTDISNPSEIWMVNADGSGQKKLIRGGYLPQWLP